MDQDPIRLNRETYNQFAADYAVRRAVMDERLTERAARLISQIPAGGRILDLGCGAGRDLGWFEAQGVRAFGADQSDGMLAETRRRQERQGQEVTKAGLCQMDMRYPGFARGSFAGIWCNAALIHLPKQAVPLALAEIRRILVPGGRFFVSVQKGQGEGIENGPTSDVSRFFARYTAQEMAQFLEQAGFQIDRQDEYEFGRIWLWYETTQKGG